MPHRTGPGGATCAHLFIAPENPAAEFGRRNRPGSMVQPVSNGISVDGSQREHGGGALISEIVGLQDVQPSLDRRPSTVSSSSLLSDDTSLGSVHSNAGSGVVESDFMTIGGGVGGGVGGAGSAGTTGPQGQHVLQQQGEGGGTKRTHSADDPGLVEQQQQQTSAGQQLRKACDLCTKVGTSHGLLLLLLLLLLSLRCCRDAFQKIRSDRKIIKSSMYAYIESACCMRNDAERGACFVMARQFYKFVLVVYTHVHR